MIFYGQYIYRLKGDNMKEALPQILFIAVLFINLGTSLIDSDRNFKASLIATIVLLALTYWGGFFKPLFDFLK
jgi:hypothetical protein